MHHQVLGALQPVLSISLEPGESIVAETGEFAWMTDSIQMAAGASTGSAPDLSTYTARDCAGTVAFAARAPGSIVGIEVGSGREYQVHRQAFLAGTPGVTVRTGLWQALGTVDGTCQEFMLQRIGGSGTAWIELSGNAVKRDLPAGSSVRTHPWHIGMAEESVAIQLAEFELSAGTRSSQEACYFAVLSGPGAVWLQPKPPRLTPRGRLVIGPAHVIPTAEGAIGMTASRPSECG